MVLKSPLFYSLFFLLISTSCIAQGTRIEIKLAEIPTNTKIVTLTKKDFLVLYKINEGRGSPFNTWNITKFNAHFNDLWNVLIEIPTRFEIKSKLYDSLYNRYIWVSTSSTQMRIDLLDLSNGDYQSQTYGLATHVDEIRSTKIIGHDLFVLFYYGPNEQANDASMICCRPMRKSGISAFKTGCLYTRIDLKNQIKYEQSDISRGVTVPDKIQNNTIQPGLFTVSIIKQKPHSNGQSELILKNLGKNLITIDSFILGARDNTYLQNAILLNSTKDYAVIGTYDSATSAHNKNNTSYSKGFYSSFMDTGRTFSPIRLYPFSEFKSIETYLKSNPYRNNHRIEAHQKATSFSTHLWLNDVIETDSEFIQTAEAYFPVYSTNTIVNGHLTQKFEGYNYAFCLVLGFNKTGQLKWDQTIPLSFNRLYETISQKVNITLSDNTLRASFSSMGKLNLVTFVPGLLPNTKTYDWPRMNPDDEKIIEYDSGETPWDKKRTLIWGVQKIKTSTIETREKNIILYIDLAVCD